MEAVDTRIQARSEIALEIYPVEIVEGEFICPNVVTVTNQPFRPSAVASGEVEDAFGPFVACGTPVEAGEGECSNCGQRYRTSGEPDEEGPPLALPKIRCPHCKEVLDPTAVLVKGSKDSTRGPNSCPKCQKYFTLVESDLLIAIDVPEEILCPGCKKPIDPSMNACTNTGCPLGGVVRNVEDFEGPCWRCGGLHLCPNCSGSGQGSQGIYGATPPDCWYCGGTGRCPECDEYGFATYEGALPPTFNPWTRDGALPSARRKWKYEREVPEESEE
jgi:hypothetical protein